MTAGAGRPRVPRMVFDGVNDALMAQMAKLQSIDPKDKDALELCISQSREVSRLANNVIRNAQTTMDFMRMQYENGLVGPDGRPVTPKMLEGGR